MTRRPISLMHSLMLNLALLPPLPERREEVAPADMTIHIGDEQVQVTKGEPIEGVLRRIDEARTRNPMEARRAFAGDREPRQRVAPIHLEPFRVEPRETIVGPDLLNALDRVREPPVLIIEPHRDSDLLARCGPCDVRPHRADPRRKARRKAQAKARRQGRGR